MSEFRTLLPATPPAELVIVPCPRCGCFLRPDGTELERITTGAYHLGAGHRTLHVCPPTPWTSVDDVRFNTPCESALARDQFQAWGIPWPGTVNRYRCRCRAPVIRRETRSAGDVYNTLQNDDGTTHTCNWT